MSGQDGRLCVFDTREQRWLPRPVSPTSVGAERGYYDYSANAAPDATADQAFAELETKFPEIRREIVASGFVGWRHHLDFLLRYSQMLRARSKLFRTEFFRNANAATLLRVEEVTGVRPSKTRPGGTDALIRYSLLQPQGAERVTLLRNLSITQMREEMKRGGGEFARRHWCLRFTRDVAHPVITADNAVVLVAFGIASREEAALHPDTLLIFPVCWQACLIGRIAPIEPETEELAPSSLPDLYKVYLKDADSRFAYSPTRVADAACSVKASG